MSLRLSYSSSHQSLYGSPPCLPVVVDQLHDMGQSNLLLVPILTEEIIGSLNQMGVASLMQLQVDGAGARAGGK